MTSKYPVTARDLVASMMDDFKRMCLITVPANVVATALIHRKELTKDLVAKKAITTAVGSSSYIVVYNLSDAMLTAMCRKERPSFGKRIWIVLTSSLGAALVREYTVAYVAQIVIVPKRMAADVAGDALANVLQLFLTDPDSPEWFRSIGLRKVGDGIDRMIEFTRTYGQGKQK